MSNIGLNVYGISLIDKDLKRIDLHNVVNNFSIMDVLDDFVKSNIRGYSDDISNERIFKFEQENELSNGPDNQKNKTYDFVYGEIKSGEYGEETEIVNAKTSVLSYIKKTDEANVLPFKFCLAIPSGEINQGIIIFQNIGRYGIKSVFNKHINEYLKKSSFDFKVDINQIAPQAYIDKCLNKGILRSIRMTRFEIPNDRSEQLGINNGVKSTYEERIIHNPVGFIERKLDEIKKYIRNQGSLTSIIQINDFEYDNLKLEFKIGKIIKTINLQNIDNLIITEDITDKVTLVKGHPTKESIMPIFKSTAEAYLEEMGLIK